MKVNPSHKGGSRDQFTGDIHKKIWLFVAFNYRRFLSQLEFS